MQMIKTTYQVHLTFIQPLLGSSPGDPEVYKKYIASRAPNVEDTAEENALRSKEDVAEEIEKAMTVFPKDEQGLFAWNYQLRGAFKENIGVLIELGDIKDISKWVYKRAVDSFLIVNPRRCYYMDTKGHKIPQVAEGTAGHLQRALRCTTMQGERVALANSEMLPEGTQLKFEVLLLEGNNKKSKMGISEDYLRWALDYGELKGFGQWRSGGWGTYKHSIQKGQSLYTNGTPNPGTVSKGKDQQAAA